MVDEILGTEGSGEQQHMEGAGNIDLLAREGLAENGDSSEEAKVLIIQCLQITEQVLESLHLRQLVQVVPVIGCYFSRAGQELFEPFGL